MCLKKAYNHVNAQDRNSFSSKHPIKADTVRVITRYSNQQAEIRQILNKLWPLLSADPIIRKCVREVPEITFRRVPSLKDHLVHSHFDTVSLSGTNAIYGTFPCGHCDICQFIDQKSKFKLPNGKWHSIKFRVTFQTPGDIYMAQCVCTVTSTLGTPIDCFFKRIRDHIKPIGKKKMDTAISRHVGIYHDFNPNVIKFLALEHVPLSSRGGSVDKMLLQLEARWI